MDLLHSISDGALLLFSAAGLAVTTVAILVDTRVQRTRLLRQSVRVHR
jgi:hypothetical protein